MELKQREIFRALRFGGVWTLLIFMAISQSHGAAFLFEKDSNSPTATVPNRLTWLTVPDIKYDLFESGDLAQWTRVNGFPKVATMLAIQHDIDFGSRNFFQIVPIDEQAPVIVARFPPVDGFGIGRLANVFVELSDSTGIDPTSLRFSVGGVGPLAPGAAGLTIEGNTLTFDPSDIALDAAGATVTASLAVADTLGNATTHTWSFRLAPEAEAAANVFVFGGEEAMQAGQQAVAGPAAALAAFSPETGRPAAVKAGPAPTPWQLDSVTTDSIVIGYDPGVPPVFTSGTLLCNLTPRGEDEVFYRRLVSTTDDAQARLLTLTTEDASLEEFIIRGGACVSPDARLLDVDGVGRIVGLSTLPMARAGVIELPAMGPDFSNFTLPTGAGVSLVLTEARWEVTPRLTWMFELDDRKLVAFGGRVDGSVRSALKTRLAFASGASVGPASKSLGNFKPVTIFSGLVGPVPVWLQFRFSLTANFQATASAEATVTGGFSHNYDTGYGFIFERGADPAVQWFSADEPPGPTVIPFTEDIRGTMSAKVSLVPEIALVVGSVVTLGNFADVHANVNPAFEIVGEVERTEEELISSEWTVRASADLNVGMRVDGVDESSLPSLNPVELARFEDTYVFPPPSFRIVKHPADFFADSIFGNVGYPSGSGRSFTLQAVATGPEGEEITYQWRQNSVPIPGATGRVYRTPSVRSGGGGRYDVLVRQGDKERRSDWVNFFPFGR